MNIDIELEELQKRSLMIAAPLYGGMCTGGFSYSIANLCAQLKEMGIRYHLHYIYNESLIPRARNYLADEFMRSDFSHMIFIDSDITFNPRDVIGFLAMMSEESNYDVLCGPYPKKCISWEKIKDAVEKGYADENPEMLSHFVGDFVFNPIQEGSFAIGEPAEVLESGTGFMMIRRKTFEEFGKAYPHQWYKPDHVRTENFDGSREICAYFDCPIDGKRNNISWELETFLKQNPKAKPKDIIDFVNDSNSTHKEYHKRYLSEDYYFCRAVRDIGLKVWLAPWVELQHMGSFSFGGSLRAIAALGASPTADVSKLKK